VKRGFRVLGAILGVLVFLFLVPFIVRAIAATSATPPPPLPG
jgi:hypothetical protein